MFVTMAAESSCIHYRLFSTGGDVSIPLKETPRTIDGLAGWLAVTCCDQGGQLRISPSSTSLVSGESRILGHSAGRRLIVDGGRLISLIGTRISYKGRQPGDSWLWHSPRALVVLTLKSPMKAKLRAYAGKTGTWKTETPRMDRWGRGARGSTGARWRISRNSAGGRRRRRSDEGGGGGGPTERRLRQGPPLLLPRHDGTHRSAVTTPLRADIATPTSLEGPAATFTAVVGNSPEYRGAICYMMFIHSFLHSVEGRDQNEPKAT